MFFKPVSLAFSGAVRITMYLIKCFQRREQLSTTEQQAGVPLVPATAGAGPGTGSPEVPLDGSKGLGWVIHFKELHNEIP